MYVYVMPIESSTIYWSTFHNTCGQQLLSKLLAVDVILPSFSLSLSSALHFVCTISIMTILKDWNTKLSTNKWAHFWFFFLHFFTLVLRLSFRIFSLSYCFWHCHNNIDELYSSEIIRNRGKTSQNGFFCMFWWCSFLGLEKKTTRKMNSMRWLGWWYLCILHQTYRITVPNNNVPKIYEEEIERNIAVHQTIEKRWKIRIWKFFFSVSHLLFSWFQKILSAVFHHYFYHSESIVWQDLFRTHTALWLFSIIVVGIE